jgi:hypothetical protein
MVRQRWLAITLIEVGLWHFAAVSVGSKDDRY